MDKRERLNISIDSNVKEGLLSTSIEGFMGMNVFRFFYKPP